MTSSNASASADLKLDREEQALLRAFERGDLKYKLATKAEQDEARNAARAALTRT